MIKKITVWVEKGVVYDVTGVPEGVFVEVRSYDVQGGGLLQEDAFGAVYNSLVWVHHGGDDKDYAGRTEDERTDDLLNDFNDGGSEINPILISMLDEGGDK